MMLEGAFGGMAVLWFAKVVVLLRLIMCRGLGSCLCAVYGKKAPFEALEKVHVPYVWGGLLLTAWTTGFL